MAGPWEDYSAPSSAQAAGPWDEFKKEDAPRGTTLADEQQENRAREYLTVPGEFFGGVGEAGKGIKQAFSNPASIFNKDLASTPQGQTLMGVLRAIASPMAPLYNAGTSAGQVVSDLTSPILPGPVSDTLAAGTSTAVDMLSPAKLIKGAQARKARMAASPDTYASPRSIAERSGKQLDEATAVTAVRKESISSGTDAAVESVESIADAAKKEIPSVTQVRERLAKDAPLGEDAGAQWQQTYKTRLKEKTALKDAEYKKATDGTDALESSAENYQAAGGTLQKGQGVTGSLPTKPEGVAARIKKAFASDGDIDEAARKQFEGFYANDPAKQQELMDQYRQASVVSEKPTVRELIAERQRLHAGMRAVKDDNSRRQFNSLIDALDEDIALAAPDKYKQLLAADKYYKDEFVPYFSKGSVTRAVAEGAPETVVGSIFRPSSDKKAVEKMTRAMELIGDNPEQKAAVGKSFMNKLIEDSFDDGVFSGKKFGTTWNKYANPTGNNDKVLRLGLGDELYKDGKSIVNQLQASKAKTIDDVAKELTASFRQSGKQQIASDDLAFKATKQKLETQIKDLMGPNISYQGGRFIGQLYMVESLFDFATKGAGAGGMKLLMGAGLLASRSAVNKLVATKRGRSLFKAAMRNAPGTVQASATARQIQNFLQDDEN